MLRGSLTRCLLLELTSLSQVRETWRQRKSEARAVADGNARAGPVFISGATGPHAAAINGFYGVTEEKSSDGRLVLSKRGDPSVCIEHRGGNWYLLSKKGKARFLASVAGGCVLEDCTSRVWRVSNGETFDEQPSVNMATNIVRSR